MTTKPVAPAPTEEQPPWEASVVEAKTQNPEAAWVAWWNFAVPVEQYDFESEQEYTEYVPLSVTIRDGEPVTNMFEQVAEFAKLVLLNGWKPISDKQWHVEDVSKPPVQQASAPLPQAAPQQAKQPWKPGGAPAPAQQQAAPVQQQQVGDNTFVADTLLVANMAKLDGTPYVAHRLKGGRYAKFGVRVWPDKLDAVLPGWSSAPPGEHPFVDENGSPFKVKCTFSWDDKPGKDGTPQPKNVYALELV